MPVIMTGQDYASRLEVHMPAALALQCPTPDRALSPVATGR